MSQYERVRDLAVRLAIDDPWSRSTEGLDDECKFCGCFETGTTVPGRDAHSGFYGHEADCVWAEARIALGLGIPESHFVKVVD